MTAAEMVESCTLEAVDLQIIRALQVDPRTPFATMASVLGVSEPTISRRYGRMRRMGLLRVTGAIDPSALGESKWMVRIRCRPGSGEAIAEALADREDVSWVELSLAGAEVTCAVRSRSRAERADLLGRKIPRAAAVLDIDASVLLHKFLGGRGHYWAALGGVLSAEQESLLGPADLIHAESSGTDRLVRLQEHDEQLLSALAADGRASIVDLAAAAGLTPGRASRRLQTLISDRVVHIHVELAPAALGYHARANLWLQVHPAETKSVGRALAKMPEVGFAAAMSGRNNLHATVHCRTLAELYEFTSDRVGPLPGVQAAEVSPIHRQIKQAGTLVVDDRLQEPSKGHRR